MVRTMTKRNAVASESAGAYTGDTECRNINGNMLFHARTGTMVLVTRSDVDFCECYTCTKRQERTDRGKMERGNAI